MIEEIKKLDYPVIEGILVYKVEEIINVLNEVIKKVNELDRRTVGDTVFDFNG